MTEGKIITEFADRVEALSISLGLSNAEFIYVLECLKAKHVNKILRGEE